jgi:hypothetical protein
MYHNKFLKHKTDKNWETYRKQRNLVTKLKKTSIKTYFFERTAGGQKSSTFYPTIKPFLSNKGMKSNNSIILCENDKIVNDPKEVIEIFNNFFVNVTKDIGDKNIKIDKAHPNINKIETNRTNKDQLFFKPINEDFVTKQINKLNIKKATGYDGISPKIIKFAQPVITNSDIPLKF